MMYTPKYKLKQKVACYKQTDGVIVYGIVVGILLKRSYKSAGMFQGGGLSIPDIEKRGYLAVYKDNIDDCEYTVLYETCNGDRRWEKYSETELISIQERLVTK